MTVLICLPNLRLLSGITPGFPKVFRQPRTSAAQESWDMICQTTTFGCTSVQQQVFVFMRGIAVEMFILCHSQNGLMSGLMQILLLKVSAHITEQLGMAPGGEFREAYIEVSHSETCVAQMSVVPNLCHTQFCHF